VQLVVGRIGRAHGIRGDVAVEVRTDDVDRRFAPGSVLDTDPEATGPLRVVQTRWHSGRLLVHFDGVEDRSAAEGLRGVLLVADSSTSFPADGPDEFWDHQLIGLTALDVEGRALGRVIDVLHPPGPDLLVVERPDAAELLVPFVASIVREVDVAGGRVVVDPPAGLLEL